MNHSGIRELPRCFTASPSEPALKRESTLTTLDIPRATYLANFLTDAQMKEYFGWQQGSKMAAVYVHLSGRDVDNALLKEYGIKNDNEKKESILKAKECLRCKQVNQATNKFCSRCGMPLDEESRTDVLKKGLERKTADDIMDGLLEDSEFREIFLRKIEMIKSKSS